MARIDKYNYGLGYTFNYNYKDKPRNVDNLIKYMLNRSNIMFQYHNLPKSIPSREIELLLQTNGFGVFIEVEGKYYIVNGGLGGEPDVYNMPTEAVISIPALKLNKTYKINEDCIVIPNDSMYLGLLPMYAKYCTLMNENEMTMLLATVNKRIQHLLSANDDNTIESAKNFLKKVFDGEIGVIGESKLFESLKVNTTSATSQVSMKDLFEYEQYLKASMYNEIGLSANFNMKRERLSSSEVEANTDNLYPLVDDMLNSRRKGLEKVNEMFGLDIQVEFNSSWDYRLFNGEPVHSINGTEVQLEETENTDTMAGDETTEKVPTTEEKVVNTETVETEEVETTDDTQEVETTDDTQEVETTDDTQEVETTERVETEGVETTENEEVGTEDAQVEETETTDDERKEDEEDE